MHLEFTTILLTIQNQIQQADHDLPVEFRPIFDAAGDVSKKFVLSQKLFESISGQSESLFGLSFA